MRSAIRQILMGAAPRFDPSQLFRAGEQGAWYDPSDFTTLFQDSAGTTPVTAVEQPVGLMLDKSGRGNHASQSTSAARPVLRAKYNLLTYTEQFDNAVWTASNTTVSANSATAPNGTITADKLIEAATTSTHMIFPATAATTASGISYTGTIYLKAAERTVMALELLGTGVLTGSTTYFDLSAGSILSGAQGSITSVGNGWYRCAVYGVSNSTATRIRVYLASAPGTASYAGDGTSGAYIWGEDLRVTNDGVGLPVYQRVAAATDYDTVGFPMYLAFDGTDDCLFTSAIDFTATDKMTVWAGVRRLVDSSTASCMYETSSAIDSNNGAFVVFGNTIYSSPASCYYSGSKGTVAAFVQQAISTNPIPATNIVTNNFNISGDISQLRVNGSIIQNTTTDQGTGNYGNYSLFIGRRNNASLQWNGRLYQLLIRGAQSTDAQIAQCETYVNSKTKAF